MFELVTVLMLLVILINEDLEITANEEIMFGINLKSLLLWTSQALMSKTQISENYKLKQI